MVALLLIVPFAVSNAEAMARLVELRATFASRPKLQSVNDLRALCAEAGGTPGGARACAWLGEIMRGDQDRDGAARAFGQAYRSADGDAHRLGARGLGDLAMEARNYLRARSYYRDARQGADGALAIELQQKMPLTQKMALRALGEWLSWLLVAALVALFAWQSQFWTRPALGVPTEALFVLPIYLLITLGGIGRDAGVFEALFLCAVGSTLLIVSAGLAARRKPPAGARRLLHAGALVAGNLALFYACCNRAAIIDSIIFTASLAAP